MRREIVWLGSLIATMVFAWCAAFGHFDSSSWGLPIRYLEPAYADFMGTCAYLKATVEEGWIPLGSKRVSRLGAPEGADWSGALSIDGGMSAFTGVLISLSSLFVGINLFFLCSQVLLGIVFYGVCRYFRCERRYAFLAALAYGLSPYEFAQTPHHNAVQCIWYVPLFLLVWRWVVENGGISYGSPRFWTALAIGFLAGMQNPYFSNVFCQLTLVGGLVAAMRERSRKPLAVAAAVVASVALGFSFINLDTVFHRLTQATSAVGPIVGNRDYRWMDIYGLKLVDLFIPYMTHRSDLFARFGFAHRQASVLNDEEGCAYLGILGGVCLLWLVAVSVKAMVERRQNDVPAATWQVLWIVLMFTTGGLNAIVASFTGFTFFRTACRYSVIILLLVLVWAAEWLTAWERDATKRFPKDMVRIGSITGFAAICLLILWDQVPRAPTPQQKAEIARQVESDRDFVRSMEDALPERAMIFQMPVMEYSGQPIQGVPPYDHFRPYLYSRNLKFSFGALPQDPQSGWQKAVRDQFNAGAEIDRDNAIVRFVPAKVGTAIQEMLREGFTGLYVNRNGFPDRGKGIEKTLQELGYTKPPIESRMGDLACFVLEKE